MLIIRGTTHTLGRALGRSEETAIAGVTIGPLSIIWDDKSKKAVKPGVGFEWVGNPNHGKASPLK